jgi:hypothetical protein
MKRLATVALLAMAGCGYQDWRPEANQYWYGKPASETSMENAERRRIYHWKTDPKLKTRVGILEKNRLRLKGTREWQDLYYIKSAGGTELLGFITEDGVFFRYDRDGKAHRVGEYKVIDTGVKVFFGFPLADNLSFEDIDPYKE